MRNAGVKAKEFKIRIVGFKKKAASAFQFNPLNWRRHGHDQREALRTMLGDVGWVQGVIENKRTGNLIDGHARIEEVLWNDPDQLVPYILVDLSPAEEKAVLATLDPIGAMAEVDPDAVDRLYEQTIAAMPGLESLLLQLHYGETNGGAGGPEHQDANVGLERAAELNQKWHVKAGDLWTIGHHRILCGDATNAADVARLLDQARPALMITDPPYGVNYDAKWRDVAGLNLAGRLGTHASKGLNTAPIDDQARSWQAAYELAPAAVAYVWHADQSALSFANDLIAAGFDLRNQIIWRKPNFVISRGHYHYQHETAWYAVRKGQRSNWIGDHAQTTVWEIASLQPMGRSHDPHDASTGHSTQKPVECMARPLRNHAGDAYDPFCGSGTTMVAAENLKRRCYALEIDPQFVAVTLERLKTAFPELPIAKVGP